MQKEKGLKLINMYKRHFDYKIEIPKRLLKYPVREIDIRIGFRNGEYQYFPRVHNMFSLPALTIDELKAITKELERLNSKEEL